jgi:hypothetical protein
MPFLSPECGVHNAGYPSSITLNDIARTDIGEQPSLSGHHTSYLTLVRMGD